MYRDAVKYGDIWLAPGSHGLELYRKKEFIELNKHLDHLDKEWRKLEGRPPKEGKSYQQQGQDKAVETFFEQPDMQREFVLDKK